MPANSLRAKVRRSSDLVLGEFGQSETKKGQEVAVYRSVCFNDDLAQRGRVSILDQCGDPRKQ